MNLGGYTNRVAWVDLTAGAVEYRPIAEEDARKYIGARGLGVKYVFDNGPQVDAAVRARAGLEPAYRHLLRRLPPGTGYPVETQSEAGPRN